MMQNITTCTLVFLQALFWYSTALPAATAFKCTKDGVTVFSDKPCDGSNIEEVYIHENFTEGQTLRPKERRMLIEIEEKEKQMAEENQPEPPVEEANTQETQTKAKPVIDKEQCKKATADLKQWQKVLALGYPPEESEYYLGEYKKKSDHQKESCGLAQ